MAHAGIKKLLCVTIRHKLTTRKNVVDREDNKNDSFCHAGFLKGF